MASWQINLAYLFSAVLFIVGLKGLTHPRSAVRGNLLGSLGMLVAVLVTLAVTDVKPIIWLAGILVGTAGGVWLARTIQMTQMPQLVAMFNSHVHPGELAAGFLPVTPAPPVPPFPPATPALVSIKNLVE